MMFKNRSNPSECGRRAWVCYAVSLKAFVCLTAGGAFGIQVEVGGGHCSLTVVQLYAMG